MNISRLYSELTNIRTYLAAIILVIFGLAFLYISNQSCLISHPNLQVVIREFGGLLVATGSVTTMWELFAKRKFLNEIMAMVGLAGDIRDAGIVKFTTDFNRGINWSELFKSVNNLDIFFAYGETWRHSNILELKDLSRRSGARIRVVLPDPDSDLLMGELECRFNMDKDNIKTKIEDAATEFKEIFSKSDQDIDFSLWYHSVFPVFSFYKFDP